jgi:2-hydroxychromene-2-carboxylate isomerase
VAAVRGVPRGPARRAQLIEVTHFTDPGCPWAWSASPQLSELRWRFGDALRWRQVMIGLSESREAYAARGYTPQRAVHTARRFRRFGMPFGRLPKPVVAATGPACRLVVAARLHAPEHEWAVLRGLQLVHFTTPLPLDTPEALQAALDRVPAPLDDAGLLRAAAEDPDVAAAYEADRALAREAEGSVTHRQARSAATDGPVRYTAPSLRFTADDGRCLEAGGFQPHAYEALAMNLDPGLERRGAPEDPAELLAAFDHGLTTREVAVLLRAQPTDEPDDDAAHAAMAGLALEGRANAWTVGDGVVWLRPGAARA